MPIRKYSLHLTLLLVQLHSPSWPRDLRVVRPFGDVTLLAIPRLTDSGLILVTFWLLWLLVDIVV